MTKVGVIGAGALGSLLADIVAQSNNAEVANWDSDPAKKFSAATADEAVAGAQVVFMCVPSWCLRQALGSIKEKVPSEAHIVSWAKGIEVASGKNMVEVIKEELPDNPAASLISGPMLSNEIHQGKPAAGILANERQQVFEEVASLFAGTRIKLQYSDDVAGVAMSGVLKNVYAIGLGIIDGLVMGDNIRGWYVALAVAEMQTLVSLTGGRPETVLGLAGIGDLIATGFSGHSKNYTVGRQLAESGSLKHSSEGVSSLPQVVNKAAGETGRLPLLLMLHDIIEKKQPAAESFGNFFK